MEPLAQLLAGPAMGAALVGLVWALATAVKRRSEASAAQDEAGAKAVVELLAQLRDLRVDRDRDRLEIDELRREVERLREDHEEEKSKRQHYESQYEIVVRELELERKRAADLAGELAELRRAITGGHSSITLPPPRKG